MNVICTHLVNLNAKDALGWFDEIVESNPVRLNLATSKPHLSRDEQIVNIVQGVAAIHSESVLGNKTPTSPITYDITLKDTDDVVVLENFTLVAELYEGGLSLYGYLATDKTDSDGEWQRVFGYSGTENGFHCDLPYVKGMAEGMAYQFWDEFLSIVPLDTINVLHYEHYRGIDIKFYERYEEAMIRQSTECIQNWVLDLISKIVPTNLDVPQLLTKDGWGDEGVEIDKEDERVIRGLVEAGRVDVAEINLYHQASRCAYHILKGVKAKDVVCQN